MDVFLLICSIQTAEHLGTCCIQGPLATLIFPIVEVEGGMGSRSFSEKSSVQPVWSFSDSIGVACNRLLIQPCPAGLCVSLHLTIEQITGPLQGTLSFCVSLIKLSLSALRLCCVLEVHSPRKVFASGLSDGLLTNSPTYILLHYFAVSLKTVRRA